MATEINRLLTTNSFLARLLLVEDERIVARDIETTLEDLGYEIVANVSSGEDAIEEAIRLKPDLLLMDIRLNGEIDGIQAATEINKFCDCPVIYLSAYSDDQTLFRAKATQPYGYLVKPFKSPELRCAIEIALHKHELEIRLREQKQWLSSTLRSVADGVIATDVEHKIMFLNPAAETLTGWKEKEALGKISNDVLNIVTEDVRSPHVINNPLLEFSRNKKIKQLTMGDGILIGKTGTKTLIEQTSAPVLNDTGKVLGKVITFRDVTERRKKDNAIRHLNNELEQRVNERTAQLEAVNKELEAFSYSVAHDLRAPLRAINGFGRILLEDNKQLDSKSLETLGKIKTATQRMSLLIEDLLRLAGIGRKDLHIQKVNLSSLVNTVAEGLRAAHPNHIVDFIFQENVFVNADLQLLRIVIENLLGNAWKFSAKISAPRVEFGTVLKDGVQICHIRDNGVGFDMKHACKLFTPFQRLHSTEEFEGTGIGLAIVHRVITRHNGKVWTESILGEGTSFYFAI